MADTTERTFLARRLRTTTQATDRYNARVYDVGPNSWSYGLYIDGRFACSGDFFETEADAWARVDQALSFREIRRDPTGAQITTTYDPSYQNHEPERAYGWQITKGDQLLAYHYHCAPGHAVARSLAVIRLLLVNAEAQQ